MVEPLADLQLRNIRTKQESGIGGVYYVGDKVFDLLKELVHDGRIRGAYFSHYYDPPNNVEPHVKVGIRFDKMDDLNAASSKLDVLCEELTRIVIDKGKFEAAGGEYPPLGNEFAVDYIICHSFEWLVRAKEKLGGQSPSPNDVAMFFLQNKMEIEKSMMQAKDIFRDSNKARPLKPEEIGWVWERFVHHLSNAYKYPYESNVKSILYRNGIMIQPVPA